MGLNPARRASLMLLGGACLGLWQAMQLQTWAFGGPGPGLFPQVVAGLCVLLSLVEVLVPAHADVVPRMDHEIHTAHQDAGPAEKRTFWIYVASIVVMVVGSYYGGFAVTTFTLVVLVLAVGEKIAWSTAIAAGALYVLQGWLAFAWLLRVNLPEGFLDRVFLDLVH